MKYLLICFVLLSGFTLSGQIYLSGTVKDATTRLPIPYATLTSDSLSIHTYCDSLGRFRIRAPEKSGGLVTISAVGFWEKQLRSDDLGGDIFLTLQPQNLDEIVIKTGKFSVLGETESRWRVTGICFTNDSINFAAQLNPSAPVVLFSTFDAPLDTSFEQGIAHMARTVGIGRTYQWKGKGIIRNVAFHIHPYGLKFLRAQLRIMSSDGKKDFLHSPVYIDWRKGDSSLRIVQLASEKVIIKDAFLVALEWIDAEIEETENALKYIAVSLPGSMNKKEKDKLNYKIWTLSNWSSIAGMTPAIKVTVQH